VQRFVVNRGGTLRYQLPVGVISASATAVSDDPNAFDVDFSGAADVDPLTGLATYLVAPNLVTQPNRWTVSWIANTGEQYTDTLDVAGGEFFSIAQARSLKPLNNEIAYSDEQIAAARVAAETAIEDACGVAFVPRYFSATTYSACRQMNRKPFLKPYLRAIRSASVNGVRQDISSVVVADDSAFWSYGSWPTGQLVIRGEWGYDAPPPRVARAALLLAKHYLVESGISSRTMRHTNAAGESDIFVTEGRGGAVFPLPEANAVVEEYGIRTGLMVA
jgi:hypothetical protein